MTLLIELPPNLEEELADEALRAGVPASERVTFLLQLITAVTREGRKTPFRSVVKAYLRQNALDADRLTEVFDGLMALCLRDDGAGSAVPDPTNPGPADSPETDHILSLLRGWRSPEANCPVDHDVDISIHELPPLDRPIPRAGRRNRVSALGSLAHLDFSSDAFIAEKRLDAAREDRPR